MGFVLGFIGFWVHYVMNGLYNDRFIVVQMQMFNSFLIIIDLESPENSTALI